MTWVPTGTAASRREPRAFRHRVTECAVAPPRPGAAIRRPSQATDSTRSKLQSRRLHTLSGGLGATENSLAPNGGAVLSTRRQRRADRYRSASPAPTAQPLEMLWVGRQVTGATFGHAEEISPLIEGGLGLALVERFNGVANQLRASHFATFRQPRNPSALAARQTNGHDRHRSLCNTQATLSQYGPYMASEASTCST